MSILSLFDGISCGRLALQRAGIPVEKYYASEIDKYAIKVAMAVVNPYDDSMYDNDKLPPLAGVRNVMQECLEGRIKRLKEQLNMEENK